MASYYLNKRRKFLKQFGLVAVNGLVPCWLSAGAQKEEYLSYSVASVMRRSLKNVNPPKFIFSSQVAARYWVSEMDKRLSRYISFAHERYNILLHLQYEASRAGLNAQLILGLVEVESRFRRYAISAVGARGLMQVMPFWIRQIGEPWHNLFDTRTNLRYGCTILRHYLDIENGNLFRALGRYNGSLGHTAYPLAVLAASKNNWMYNGLK